MTTSLGGIKGLIRRRILVNYRVNPELIQRELPRPFRPKLHGSEAIAGICLIRMEQVRPAFMPMRIGVYSENAAHRVAVVWDDEDGLEREGVFIVRRDTSSPFNRLLGGRAFPGEQQSASFDVEDTTENIRLSVSSSDGDVEVRLTARLCEHLPTTSQFASMDEASRFFERGADGYSARKSSSRLEGMQLRSPDWRVEPLDVSEHFPSYFTDETRFPRDSVTFDSALIMRDLQHEWRRLPLL